MLLTVKHGGKWDFLALIFTVKAPTFERMVITLLEVVSEIMHAQFVEQMHKKYSMLNIWKNRAFFVTFHTLHVSSY